MNFVEQLECLEKLESLILKKAAMLAGCNPGDNYRSEHINDLIDALSMAQAEFPPIQESCEHDEILMLLRPILAQYGLACIQQYRIDRNDTTRLHTIVSHKSGQWLESRCLTGSHDHPWLRKRSLINMLGIIVSVAIKAPEPVVQEEPITIEQMELLEDELNDHPDLAKMILEQWKLKHLHDMPKSKYITAIKKIREIKMRTGKQ